jgi:hypothetical protein
MKLHVVYDRSGNIQAAVHLDAPEDPARPRLGELRPVLKRGELAGDFEVPAEYASRDFATVCSLLRVDPKRRALTAAERPAKRSPARKGRAPKRK